MRTMPDGSRLYGECKHCPDVQLDPEHIFSCRFIISAIFKIDIDCTRDVLYFDKAEDVARGVLHALAQSNCTPLSPLLFIGLVTTTTTCPTLCRTYIVG
ncbi:hypothetical protein HNY73_002889 [Argiope bruennichi]|uniref:Uncharacterized protein n=1 Tax=Argiope bruennichi TaxID=94029 RepID=A0A8T0FXJ9_ARGBR|nr:hypothetical protein HNY73_002889 [Argiope bruennichi]